MTNKNVIGLKYCGGCRPTFDRIAAVARIISALEPWFTIVPWSQCESAEDVLIVAGCMTACVDRTPFEQASIHVVRSDQEADAFIEKMKSAAVSF